MGECGDQIDRRRRYRTDGHPQALQRPAPGGHDGMGRTASRVDGGLSSTARHCQGPSPCRWEVAAYLLPGAHPPGAAPSRAAAEHGTQQSTAPSRAWHPPKKNGTQQSTAPSRARHPKGTHQAKALTKQRHSTSTAPTKHGTRQARHPPGAHPPRTAAPRRQPTLDQPARGAGTAGLGTSIRSTDLQYINNGCGRESAACVTHMSSSSSSPTSHVRLRKNGETRSRGHEHELARHLPRISPASLRVAVSAKSTALVPGVIGRHNQRNPHDARKRQASRKPTGVAFEGRVKVEAAGNTPAGTAAAAADDDDDDTLDVESDEHRAVPGSCSRRG
ncbi:hypothetical protein DCS_04118 [Drechmeria coniospora]|uniref:Uncharacterized protein n=1 Tax=Drechmeria coniospora TaxID=98403 RepID=A0A151GJ98_DRECN|nr:hypothetical protein DCS_04118 [Drechmeria coniospora]KYK57111.1 hypothetical protein DCS_04118 [Drechmeria coniospora]